jgi:opacity protein-like surface antigen
MMKKITLSLLTTLALGTFAFAGGDIDPVEPKVVIPQIVPEVVTSNSAFYLGLGYSYLKMDQSTTPSKEITGNAGLILAGYDFNDYIGLQARYAMNLGDLTAPTGTTADTMMNVGGYLKAMYPISQLNVYGLVGYGQTTFKDTTDHSEAGFQWGAGLDYGFTKNIGMFVDYTRLYDDTSFDTLATGSNVLVDSVNVGVTYSF